MKVTHSIRGRAINLIQTVATPHNNVLIGRFKNFPKLILHLWYAKSQDVEKYQWEQDISNEHFSAEIYGESINWRFIKHCLQHRDERYIIVGWSNPNTLLLHLLFFILRRPYSHWSDLPNTVNRTLKQRIIRYLSYIILRYSKSIVFCVGKPTINYFKSRGFSDARLVNLPIFVETDEDISVYRKQRDRIIERYCIRNDDFIISAGSRIVHEKGYDLLIKAITLLDNDVFRHIKVIIVGSGSSSPDLEKMIQENDLGGKVILEKWLAIDEFKALIANSDVFIHPARVDSYGGTTLGMALGVPVIGSYGAGAAVDRIKQGKNGFLYYPEDLSTLANFMTLFYLFPKLKKHMGDEACKTAKSWPPERGVEILYKNAI